MSQKMRQIIIFFIGTALGVGLDQWTKYLAFSRLKGQDAIVLWKDVFELQYLENRGAAFGMLQGKQGFFFVIAAVVLAAAVYFLWKMPCSKKYLPLFISLCLITAGAIGNMIDRVRLEFVIDFLYFKLINFPIFNVADCYVTVATAAVMILILFYYQENDLEVFGLGGIKKANDEQKDKTMGGEETD